MPAHLRRWALLAIAAVAACNLVLLAVPPVRQLRWAAVAMLLISGVMVVALHLLARPCPGAGASISAQDANRGTDSRLIAQ